ncbi:MAG: hypothetical protein ACRDDY_02380 [Clostridium sp.]|uniref:hypothetical protein n=1 Tax=Clostridium sp. TaxID=1506 RepID=UPI003EE75036
MNESVEKNLREFFRESNNEKVIFIGAGFSKNLGLPSWIEFGRVHLEFLEQHSDKVNFELIDLLKREEKDFRRVMSFTKDIIFEDENLKIISL